VQDLTKVKFQLFWIFDAAFGGEYLAAERGYYRRAGLDVELAPGGPSIATEPLIAAKKAFAALSNPEYTAAARAQGAPIKIVAAQFQSIPWEITSLASAPIRTPRQMIGKKIGVPALNEVAWKAFLTMTKIDPSKVKKVRVGFDPVPLLEKEVDGLMAYSPNQPVSLAIDGIKTHSMPFNKYGYFEFSSTLMVHEDTLESDEDRETLIALIKADRRGWNDYRNNPAAGARLAVNKYGRALGLKLKNEIGKAKAYSKLIDSPETKKNGLFTMSDASIAKTIRTMRISGIKADKSLFDQSIMREIARGG
jgi:ABC-type nitrate/sulfonate/bicarbonate transport system substrate-binding protein